MHSKFGLSIGQVADRTGLSPSAIRYYEDEGLVSPNRNTAGQRRYANTDIRRLSFVMLSQKLGFTISEIREALSSLPADRAPTKTDWTRISKKFGSVLDERITTMQSLRDRLDDCIGCGCLSLKRCHLSNPNDIHAESGSGPRLV